MAWDMVPRDTRTGGVLEGMVIPALERGGDKWKNQQLIGQRPSGGEHRVDVLASKSDGREIPISLKWQQTSGTAEQKVPFEVICLADVGTQSQRSSEHGYLALGG